MATTASGSMDPDKIPGTTFATSFRGFDADEVRSYLHRVAGEVRALQHRNDELKAQLTSVLESAPEPAAEPVELDEAEVTRLLGAETARVLATARESAGQIEATAREDAERVEADAGVRAAEIEASAETVLADRTAEAEAAVEELLDEGRRGRDELIAEGETERDRLIGEGTDSLEAAKEDGRQMVAEAKALRHKILTDMARRRNVGRRQLEQLRASRERLLEGYSSLRRSLEESVTEVQQSAEDAKVAGDRAGRRVNIDEIESIEELEAEVDLAKSTGLLTLDAPSDADDDAAVLEAGDGAGQAAETEDDADAESDEGAHADAEIEADEDSTTGDDAVADEAAGVEVDAALDDAAMDDAAVGEPGVDEPAVDYAAVDEAAADEIGTLSERYPDQPPLGSVARPHGSSHVTVLGPIDSETGEVIMDVARADDAQADDVDDAAAVEAEDDVELDADPVFADDGSGGDAEQDEAEQDDTVAEETEAQVESADDAADEVLDLTDEDADVDADASEVDASDADAAADGAVVDDEEWEGIRILGPSDSADTAEASGADADADGGGAEAADDEVVIDLREDSGAATDADVGSDADSGSGDAGSEGDLGEGAPASAAETSASPIVVQRRQKAPAPVAAEPSSVDALFAQLRADSSTESDQTVNEPFAKVGPSADDASETVTAETAATDATRADTGSESEAGDAADEGESVELADQASDPADRALLSRRDAMVDGVVRDLGRRLKRALSDDQNDLLERIRAKNGTFATDDLPSADEQLAAFGLSCRNELRLAAEVGASFIGGADAENFDASTVDLSDVEDEIAGAIAMPLRERFEEAIAETGGEPDQLAERLRASYREVRSQRINPLADHFALVAFARGGQQIAAPKTKFRWVSDNCGPDCLDNALEGELAVGTAFPTGHSHPPSHLGCRCLLAVVD